jgi:hypothetical protein
MIARVGDVKIVARVGCDALRRTQAGCRLRARRLGEAAALSEYNIRRKADTDSLRERLIVFEHSTVERIRDVEVARAVHGDAARQAQTIWAQAREVAAAGAAVAARSSKIGLADLDVCILAVDETGGVVPSEDAAVVAVHDVQMLGSAAQIDGHLAWRFETRRAGVVDAVVREVDLSEHRVRDVVAGRRYQHRDHEHRDDGYERDGAQTKFGNYSRRFLRGRAVFHLTPRNRSEPARGDMESNVVLAQ